MNLGNRNDRKRARGFMLLEILVAIAFLAIATGFALNMHQARLDYDHKSIDRLRQQLMIENVAEQLGAVPYAELPESVRELATPSGVDVNVEPFEVDSGKGIHIVLRITSESGPLKHHYWRLEPIR